VATIFIKIKGNIAKGHIVNIDLSTTPCYVIKQINTFAHGKTLHEAQKALNDKLFEDMPEEERIEAFLWQFSSSTEKYPAKDYFAWHGKLTGSCEFGREQFVKGHNIDMDSKFTVDEFIELTKEAYGKEVIMKLKEQITKGD